jgi:hypothetical protein
MTLRVETLRRTDSGNNEYPEPLGEYLDTISHNRGTLKVLTRVRDTDDDPTTVSDLGESDGHQPTSTDDHPTNDDGEPLCTGKEDGQCSRTVETPGDACWQHE